MQGTNVGTFGSKPRGCEFINKTNINPGPGSYKHDKSKKTTEKSYSFSFGKGDKTPKVRSSIPGPGYYITSKDCLFGKHTPKFSIGKAPRPKEINSYGSLSTYKMSNGLITPGPGEYQFNSKIGEGPKVSLKGKETYNPKNTVPGPGSYNNVDKDNILKKSPKWKLGSSVRDSNNINSKDTLASPGPGRYKEKSDFDLTSKFYQTGYKFAIDPKLKWIKTETPGPGHYLIPATIGSNLRV